MHRKLATRTSALVLAATVGIALALTISRNEAHAYTIGDLPNLGFGVVFISLPTPGCHQYKVGWRNDPKTDLGSDCDPAFQQRLDDFMAAHCPPYVCPVPTVTIATTDLQTTTETWTLPEPPPVTTTVAVAVRIPPPPDDDPAPYVHRRPHSSQTVSMASPSHSTTRAATAT
jgi:hypothetical protein